jgi:putative flippase GtrA
MTIDWLVTRWHENERFRFLVVGAWNTGVGYLTFLVLYTLLHDRIGYLLISVLAHVVAAISAFIAHRAVVFKSSKPWFAEYVRFNLSQLTVVGFGLVALWLLVSFAQMNPLAAQAIVIIVAVIISYLMHRHVTFTIR